MFSGVLFPFLDLNWQNSHRKCLKMAIFHFCRHFFAIFSMKEASNQRNNTTTGKSTPENIYVKKSIKIRPLLSSALLCFALCCFVLPCGKVDSQSVNKAAKSTAVHLLSNLLSKVQRACLVLSKLLSAKQGLA